MISTGVPCTPLGKAVAESPSATTTTRSGAQKDDGLQPASWGQIPDPQKDERLGAASWSSGRDAHVGPDAGTSARHVDFLKDLP